MGGHQIPQSGTHFVESALRCLDGLGKLHARTAPQFPSSFVNGRPHCLLRSVARIKITP